MIHLLNANALHIPLAANTVQCVITSPPYWGLRDYGTAEWIGGSGDCDHVESEIRTGQGLAALGEKYRGGGHKQGMVTTLQYKAHCFKCGAIRKDAQLGLEATPDEFLANMVSVFREVWRVLKDDGVLWLNMGDSYATTPPGNRGKHAQGEIGDGNYARKWDRQLGHGEDKKAIYKKTSLPPKNLIGMPWRLAFALQSDGWILRSDIIWAKPNPMPESVTDRPTKAHEYVFLLSKQGRYFYDADAVRENHVRLWNPLAKNGSFTGGGIPRAEKADGRIPNPKGRNRRTVWTVATQPYSGSHFATFPTALIEPMILAGSRPGDLVLDPFSGTATVGEVSRKHHRRYVGLELNPKYIELAKERTQHIQPTLLDFNSVMP
jgi:DNA modification methylase